jgi:hypothetical protein
MKLFKNNTIYKGKIYFKFEKNPFYEQHYDTEDIKYISILDSIIINFFNKFYLSKRIKSDGYTFDEEKINLIKRQGLKIKTKIELIDKNFKVLDTKIVDDYTTNIEIDNPDNVKIYLTYFVTNKNDIKVGDLFFAWDIVQEDIIDLDVASKRDDVCSIGFNRKKQQWIGYYYNESKLFDVNQHLSYDNAKKLAIEFVKNIKKNKK